MLIKDKGWRGNFVFKRMHEGLGYTRGVGMIEKGDNKQHHTGQEGISFRELSRECLRVHKKNTGDNKKQQK